ncbi:MAG: NYN domain-containing protein [Chloroflexi bacterium]|nr:NYN domain-containing protein [Chloroflexota bacterium]
MNVIGSRPDGWWRDRAAAARRLVRRLETLAGASGDELTVVFDGRPGRSGPPEQPEAEPLRVLYARRGGRNAADDRIVELVADDADPASLTVVTSDAALRRELEALGASVVGASTLLRRLDALEGGAEAR